MSSGLWLATKNTKALYRRCQAYEHLGQIHEAYKDSVVLQYLEPKKSMFKRVLTQLETKIRDQIGSKQGISIVYT